MDYKTKTMKSDKFIMRMRLMKRLVTETSFTSYWLIWTHMDPFWLIWTHIEHMEYKINYIMSHWKIRNGLFGDKVKSSMKRIRIERYKSAGLFIIGTTTCLCLTIFCPLRGVLSELLLTAKTKLISGTKKGLRIVNHEN